MSSLRRYVKTERNWRSAVWNRWLISYLTPKNQDAQCRDSAEAIGDAATCASQSGKPDSAPPASGTQPIDVVAANEAGGASPDMALQKEAAPQKEPAPREDIAPQKAERVSVPPPSSDDFGALGDAATAEQWAQRRRAMTRARLEALNDQISHVQDSVDALSDRLERERLREQRRLQRLEQLVESAAGTGDRNLTLLEGVIERLERLERRLGVVAASVLPPARSESVLPKATFFRPSNAAAPRGEERLDDEESPPESGPHGRGAPDPAAYRTDDPSISGTLSEISLATILSMFELEQRTGRLKLTSRSLPRVSFDLLDGVVVGSQVNDEEVDPVGALQRALEWQDGRFTFCHGAVVASPSHARSVGSLLLEATRRNDEAIR